MNPNQQDISRVPQVPPVEMRPDITVPEQKVPLAESVSKAPETPIRKSEIPRVSEAAPQTLVAPPAPPQEPLSPPLANNSELDLTDEAAAVEPSPEEIARVEHLVNVHPETAVQLAQIAEGIFSSEKQK